jgi:hypothetical protein
VDEEIQMIMKHAEKVALAKAEAKREAAEKEASVEQTALAVSEEPASV